MNKADLHSFITLAQEQSFTKAAEKLHITQPALSKRIARLEAQLNCTLLDRNNKSISLNQSGAVFLIHAHSLISAINNCETEIHNLEHSVSGQLRLGVSHHIGLHRLPSYLQQFTEQHPEVELKISFVDSEQAYDMIINNQLELALATLAPIEPENI